MNIYKRLSLSSNVTVANNTYTLNIRDTTPSTSHMSNGCSRLFGFSSQYGSFGGIYITVMGSLYRILENSTMVPSQYTCTQNSIHECVDFNFISTFRYGAYIDFY